MADVEKTEDPISWQFLNDLKLDGFSWVDVLHDGATHLSWEPKVPGLDGDEQDIRTGCVRCDEFPMDTLVAYCDYLNYRSETAYASLVLGNHLLIKKRAIGYLNRRFGAASDRKHDYWGPELLGEGLLGAIEANREGESRSLLGPRLRDDELVPTDGTAVGERPVYMLRPLDRDQKGGDTIRYVNGKPYLLVGPVEQIVLDGDVVDAVADEAREQHETTAENISAYLGRKASNAMSRLLDNERRTNQAQDEYVVRYPRRYSPHPLDELIFLEELQVVLDNCTDEHLDILASYFVYERTFGEVGEQFEMSADQARRRIRNLCNAICEAAGVRRPRQPQRRGRAGGRR